MCVSIYKYSQLNTNGSISDSEKPKVLTEEETEIEIDLCNPQAYLL